MSWRARTPRSWRVAALGLALMPLLAPSCSTIGAALPQSRPVGGDLDRWVDEELTPYLVSQLAEHPRFRAQPVLLVSMAGDDVEADIDELTAGIRDRIKNALLQTPGAHLYWRPTTGPWRHHRSLEELRCDEQRRLRYLIGLDIKPVPGGDIAVAVRALDYQDSSWVSGFGKQWRGRPTALQSRLLGARQTDEYLRGLRVLPFDVDQADLMAAYLARNLSCLVREIGEGPVAIGVEPLPGGDPFFERVYELVGNYLSRFREVRVTTDPDEADFMLRGEVHPIHGGLNQMWVAIEAPAGGYALAGADTEAYAQVVAHASRPAASGPSTRAAGERAESEPFGAILSNPRLLQPTDPAACEGSIGWASRSWATTGPLVLPPRACFAFEVAVEKPSHVFVLSHDDRGALLRLLPSSCQAVRAGENSYGGGQTLRYPRPLPGHGASFLVSRRPGVETYYVIAASGSAAIRDLADHVSALGSACGRWPPSIVHRSQIRSWLATLDTLARRHAGAIQWRSLEVRHAY